MNVYAITIVNQTFIDETSEPFFDVITFLAKLTNTQSQDVHFLKELATRTQITPAYSIGNERVIEKVMKVIDIYELVDQISFGDDEYPEVNSRQIVPPKAIKLDEFLSTYFGDFVLEDEWYER